MADETVSFLIRTFLLTINVAAFVFSIIYLRKRNDLSRAMKTCIVTITIVNLNLLIGVYMPLRFRIFDYYVTKTVFTIPGCDEIEPILLNVPQNLMVNCVFLEGMLYCSLYSLTYIGNVGYVFGQKLFASIVDFLVSIFQALLVLVGLPYFAAFLVRLSFDANNCNVIKTPTIYEADFTGVQLLPAVRSNQYDISTILFELGQNLLLMTGLITFSMWISFSSENNKISKKSKGEIDLAEEKDDKKEELDCQSIIDEKEVIAEEECMRLISNFTACSILLANPMSLTLIFILTENLWTFGSAWFGFFLVLLSMVTHPVVVFRILFIGRRKQSSVFTICKNGSESGCFEAQESLSMKIAF